jgi:hypothetical protein
MKVRISNGLRYRRDYYKILFENRNDDDSGATLSIGTTDLLVRCIQHASD